MRRSFCGKATALTIVAALTLLALCVLISGCSYTQESAYIGKINPIMDRYNNTAKQFQQIGTQYEKEMNTVLSNPDGASTLSAINQVVDKYLPQFQQIQAQLQQMQAELNALQPPTRFTNSHAKAIQGIDTVARAIAELINAMNLSKNPNTANEAVIASQNATSLANEGDRIMSEAHKDVSAKVWPVLIGILVGVLALVLVVASAFGYWSGRIARSNGEGFWVYFLVGFFFAFFGGLIFGFLGVLITWLVTRGGRRPKGPQPQYGYAAQAVSPGEVPPPGYTAPPAPAPAGPTPKARAVPPGNTVQCRYCGTMVPMTKPKCPSCGRMMMGL